MKHHPSCRENDESLVWHCEQCGQNESAESLHQERDRLAEQVKELKAEYLHLMEENERLDKDPGHTGRIDRLSELKDKVVEAAKAVDGWSESQGNGNIWPYKPLGRALDALVEAEESKR